MTKIQNLLMAIIIALMFIACRSPIDPIDPQDPITPDLDIFIVDISRETDWNYMVVGRDGSSIFFSVDEATDIPTRLFLRPNNNSDAGFTFVFKENGLPDKMIANGYILYFGNFSGYTFDLAIICPLGTIQYHFGIETDVNWNAYNNAISMSSLSQGRFISLPRLNRSLNFISHAIGIGTCAAGFFFLPALGGCAAYVASLTGSAVVSNVFDGITADVLNMSIDTLGCVFGNVFDCIVALSNSTYTLSNWDINLANQRGQEIAQKHIGTWVASIEGFNATITVTSTWWTISIPAMGGFTDSGQYIFMNAANARLYSNNNFGGFVGTAFILDSNRIRINLNSYSIAPGIHILNRVP